MTQPARAAAWSQRAGQGRQREQRHARDEQLAPPEQVGGSTAKQQEAAEQQRVAVDDPLQVGLAEAEVGLDRRPARRWRSSRPARP
jgi:hypothetical protein